MGSAVLMADSRSIEFDATVDFSTVGTFEIRAHRINSEKPELNNRLFVQAVEDRIRATLTTKRLKEVAELPDVFVDFSVAGADYTITGGQRGTRIPGGPGRRGGVVFPGTGPRPELFTEGTLVIDMTMRSSGRLVWRGIYRDEERSGPTLARKLPDDARKLLSEYPPGKVRLVQD
jgi:hypothetical protein